MPTFALKAPAAGTSEKRAAAAAPPRRVSAVRNVLRAPPVQRKPDVSAEGTRISRRSDRAPPGPGSAGCTPAAGYSNDHCSIYRENAWWLPLAYVNNATCACETTPNVPTARCVRKFLQDRLASKPTALKAGLSLLKVEEFASYALYQSHVQMLLTPDIYRDHVDAYRSCCCPHGPAPYPAWIGVTSVPLQPCDVVGWSIRNFGSCTGEPDSW